MPNIPKFKKPIYLASPTMHGDELKYIKEAYETNWVSSVGKNIDEVENLICNQVGCKYAVGLNSGSAALHLAIRLANIKHGDKVFCSDFTFSATADTIVMEGGIPIFIDSEYETWNMDPKALQKAFELYPNVKVVVVTNLYGTPAKLDKIKEICDSYNAILIEDAAESLGATYKGKQTGSFGKYNAISFNGNKIITGSAGGILLTDDIDSFNKARGLAMQSNGNSPWYQHEELGFNYRMSNIVAGIIRGQLPYLYNHISKKKEIYERYKEGLKNLPITLNPYIKDIEEPNFWLTCLLVNKDAMCKQVRSETQSLYYNKDRSFSSCPDEIYQTLAKYNVQSRPVWKPMHLQPLYKSNIFVKALDNMIDVSRDLFERGLCLPSDINMKEEEQNIIIRIIRSCFE